MKEKEIFTLAVRLLGLVFLYLGLHALPAAVVQIISSFPHELATGFGSPMNTGGFVMGVAVVGWPLLVAYWLVRGAPFLLQTAYPDASGSTKEGSQIGGELGRRA